MYGCEVLNLKKLLGHFLTDTFLLQRHEVFVWTCQVMSEDFEQCLAF